MNDQATTLRLMAAANPADPSLPRDLSQTIAPSSFGVRTIAITSGKGGVGKSNFAVNVALELAGMGRRVSLLDADLGLANADVLFGLNPKYHLGNVLNGQRTLSEIVIEVDENIRLIPGGSGVEELANLSRDQHSRLVSELRAMEDDSDFMLIDTAAGIAENVTGVLRAASEIVIVTTPDPTAVVDAYAIIKVLHQHTPTKQIWVVINDVVGLGDSEQIFSQLKAASERFLGHTIHLLGAVPRDAELARAVREQTPVVNWAPNAPASRAFRLIAKYLDKSQNPPSGVSNISTNSFWSSLTEAEA